MADCRRILYPLEAWFDASIGDRMVVTNGKEVPLLLDANLSTEDWREAGTPQPTADPFACRDASLCLSPGSPALSPALSPSALDECGDPVCDDDPTVDQETDPGAFEAGPRTVAIAWSKQNAGGVIGPPRNRDGLEPRPIKYQMNCATDVVLSEFPPCDEAYVDECVIYQSRNGAEFPVLAEVGRVPVQKVLRPHRAPEAVKVAIPGAMAPFVVVPDAGTWVYKCAFVNIEQAPDFALNPSFAKLMALPVSEWSPYSEVSEPLELDGVDTAAFYLPFPCVPARCDSAEFGMYAIVYGKRISSPEPSFDCVSEPWVVVAALGVDAKNGNPPGPPLIATTDSGSISAKIRRYKIAYGYGTNPANPTFPHTGLCPGYLEVSVPAWSKVTLTGFPFSARDQEFSATEGQFPIFIYAQDVGGDGLWHYLGSVTRDAPEFEDDNDALTATGLLGALYISSTDYPDAETPTAWALQGLGAAISALGQPERTDFPTFNSWKTDAEIDDILIEPGKQLDPYADPPPSMAVVVSTNNRLFGMGDVRLNEGLVLGLAGRTDIYIDGAKWDRSIDGKILHIPSTGEKRRIERFFKTGSDVWGAYLAEPLEFDALHVEYEIYADGNKVHYSRPRNPEWWPLSYSKEVDFGEQCGRLVAAHANLDGVLISTPTQTGVLRATDEPTRGVVSRLSTSYGCIAPRSMRTCGDRVYWLADRAVVSTTGASIPQSVSEEIRPIFDDIKRDTSGMVPNAVGAHYRQESQYWLAVPTTEAGIANDLVLVYDYVAQLWTIYRFPMGITTLDVVTNPDTGLEELWIGDENGFSWRYGDGWTDGLDASLHTLTGTVTSLTDDTIPTLPIQATKRIHDSAASWSTSGLGLAGAYIKFTSGASVGEKFLIRSNDATSILPDTPILAGDVAVGDSYMIGAIRYYWKSKDIALGDITKAKHVRFMQPFVEKESQGGTLTARYYPNFSPTPEGETEYDLDWAFNEREVSGRASPRAGVPISPSPLVLGLELENEAPEQPVRVKLLSLEFDALDH